MAFGFGSEIVGKLVHVQLGTIGAVTSVVGTNRAGRGALIQGEAMPAVLFYPESSSYDPPAFSGDNIGMEVLGYVIRFVDRGTSTSKILPAALAARQHFNGQAFDVTDAGQNYRIAFDALGAVPLTTITDGADMYRQLGTVYRVHVTLGG